MLHNHHMQPWQRKLTFVVSGLLIAFMVLTVFTAVQHVAGAAALPNGGETPLLQIDATLEPAQTIAPTFNADETAIFSLTLSDGTGPVELVITSGVNTLWSGQVLAGETIWGSAELAGTNEFALTNLDGSASVDFAFRLYSLPEVAYTWSGVAAAAGENSEIELTFAESGIYEFAFDLTASERFLFKVNDSLIQKMVSSTRTDQFFIPAGTHTLTIEQDSGGGMVAWSVAVSYTGTGNDTTPFSQDGTAVDDVETILFAPAAPIQVNLVFTATNATADLAIYDNSSTQIGTTRTILDGETVWQSYDLPAGVNQIEISASGGTLDYALTIYALPVADGYTIAGMADAAGMNSLARLNFDQAGLYTFDYTVGAGRYQFLVNSDYIQKTAEADGAVTYYVPQGIHELIIDQDSTDGAAWELAITREAAPADSLPYNKAGAELGGGANDFDVEWLPIFLSEAASVNVTLAADGESDETLALAVYAGSSGTPNFTLNNAYGTEELWQTLDLAAGLNRIKIMAAGGNTEAFGYELMIQPIPQAGTVAWSGSSQGAGIPSVVRIEFPTSGLYRFGLTADQGFANLLPGVVVVDGAPTEVSSVITGTFDLEMSAGVHPVTVLQDNSFPQTDWSATVAPVPAGPAFLTINADLEDGETITQQFPGGMDFNVMATTNGGDLDVSIQDGDSSDVWSETILDGETAWGTGTFSGTNEIGLTNNSGGLITASLTFYHIPSADGYGWDGLADAAGLNSHIRVNFPSSGLYTFDLGQDDGRYQFLVDSEWIQKTVEGDDSLTAFVTAGVHDLYLIQDSGDGADWDVAISAEAASNDSLPYAAAGGELGDNDFTTEWLPLELGSAAMVNIELSVTGAADDQLSLTIHDSGGVVATLAPVYGGETVWMSMEMPASARLQLEADGGNGAPLSYALEVTAIPSTGNSFAGQSYDYNGVNSGWKVTFPASGLYQFDLAATSGQFQFALGADQILKTVTGTSSVSYYVPAGTHELSIIQDDTPATTTNWSVTVNNVGASADSLPYEKMGGAIGTVFTDEWLPIHLGESMMANLRITALGDDTDEITVTIMDGAAVVSSFTVAGTETLWQAVELPADGRIHLTTSTADEIDYSLRIEAVAAPSYDWSGQSLGSGTEPTFFVDVPVRGLYQIIVNSEQGFINFSYELDAVHIEAGIVVTSEVELAAGVYTFTGSPSAPINEWNFDISLLEAFTPDITTITPAEVSVNQSVTVTINGSNFWVDKVELVAGADRYELSVVAWDENSITATVPATVPVGSYDLVVTNLDAQTAELADAFTVNPYALFMPIITNP